MVGELPLNQVPLCNLQLFIFSVTRQADNFHPIHQRLRHIQGVGGGHEHHIRQIEIHFPDETLDLYDQPLQVAVLKQIRQEKRFPSMEALKHQIANDLLAARPIQLEHKAPLDFIQ